LNENHEFVIHIADEQSFWTIDARRLRLAVERILAEASISRAEVSVALVDDPTIQKLNQRYLRHDWPTDVLSFVLERSADHLDGQIVVSAETARGEAARYGWSADDELLLYVIHGALHLVGYDDTTPERQAAMREKEQTSLEHFGLKLHWDTSSRFDHSESEENAS